MGFLLGLSVTGGSFEERRIWSHMSILHMEQYLTHYKHTVGITVGFRDVGDVANTGGSVNYKVSI